MNLFALAGLLTGLSSVIFGIFVFVNNPARRLNRVWLIFTLTTATWGFGAFGIALSKNPESAYLLWKLAFGIGVVWIAVLFLHFVYIFCDVKQKAFLVATYVLGVVFSCLALTPYFFSGVRFVFNSFYYGVPHYKFFSVFVLWWFGTIIYGHYLLIATYKPSPEPKQRQIKYFFIAAAIGYVGGSLAYLPFFGIELYPWGTFAIFLYPIIMSYAVIEHQLMDVNLAIKKALLYSIIIALISWGLTLIIFAANWLAETTGVGFPFMAVAGGIIAFLIGKIFWKKSQEIDRLKYEFITIAAHKLRTPLTHIRWEIYDLQNISSIDGARTLAQKMKDSIDKVVELVDVLLKTAEEKKMYSYSFKNINLLELSEKILMDYDDQIKKKNLAVSLKSEIPLPLIKADPEKLSIVIQMFLENALIYTPESGAISITINSYDVNFIIFTIRDTGIGILKSDLPYIFLRLYRAHNATLAHTEGSGVGLFIAKSIVERHKGIVGVDSEGQGKGSTFWFILPKVEN